MSRYCDEIENVENYEKAKADNFKGWVCHHRLETHNSDGERRLVDIKREELIALGMYWHRPASELVFLKSDEHNSLHHKYKSSCMRGKHHSEETKRKISKARVGSQNNKGKHWKLSDETKKKLSEAHKGQVPWNKDKCHSEDTKDRISKTTKDRMAKVRQSYKEYKLSGGSLKWNDFQKQYRGE